MKLKYNQDYLSIKKFNDVELPNFTILTGLNGAGKSHLFKAIKGGAIIIEDISIDQIVEFDNVTFSLDNETVVSSKTLEDEKNKLFEEITKINQQTKPHVSTFLNDIEDVFEIFKTKDISFYKLQLEDFTENSIAPKFENYKNYVNIIYHNAKQTRPGNQNNLKNIVTFLDLATEPIHKTKREDLDIAFIPYSYKNDFLITQLGKIFTDYWQKRELNIYNTFRNNTYGDCYRVFTEAEFVKEHGEKPWDIINNILSRFGSLDYNVNNPEGIERGHNFHLKLISTKDPSVIIDFSNLSSGERIMMALVSTLYKAKMDNAFPKLLLLDEIDASLHPSMTNNMLDILKNEVVIAKNINIILITHSPSTVALAPENSIYLMNKDGEERIVKSTNKEALNILTEGFASLTVAESNLRISYNISKASNFVLCTEGITDRIIIEAAWNKIETTPISFDIQDCFDASFLRNIFVRGEIFNNYNSKTFIALFDFDKEGYECWNNMSNFEIIEDDPKKGLLKKHKTQKAYALLLPVPTLLESQVIESGKITYKDKSHLPIELLFYGNPKVAANFINEPQVGGGNLMKFVGGKTTFANEIAGTFIKEDFNNFIPLLDTIKTIMK